jgi:hypothetical protein
MYVSCLERPETVLFAAMALIPIKTASETGYCDCICGCYELASLRDDETGKSFCPACGKDHLDLNAGAGILQPAPANVSPNAVTTRKVAEMPSPADPPGRLRPA